MGRNGLRMPGDATPVADRRERTTAAAAGFESIHARRPREKALPRAARRGWRLLSQPEQATAAGPSHCGITIFCPTFSVFGLRPGLAVAIFFHWFPSPYWVLAMPNRVSPFWTV